MQLVECQLLDLRLLVVEPLAPVMDRAAAADRSAYAAKTLAAAKKPVDVRRAVAEQDPVTEKGPAVVTGAVAGDCPDAGQNLASLWGAKKMMQGAATSLGTRLDLAAWTWAAPQKRTWRCPHQRGTETMALPCGTDTVQIVAAKC